MTVDIYQQIFEKYSNIKFHGNPSSGGVELLLENEQTDRRDEANSRFSQFCERA